MNISKAMIIIKNMIEQKKLPSDDFRIEAYNTIASYLIKVREADIENNDLLFKLYVSCFTMYAKNMGLEMLSEIPIKEFHKSLDSPINIFIEKLCTQLNDLEQQKFLDDLDICKKHPILESTDENRLSVDKMQSAILDPIKRNQLFCTSWKLIAVEEKIKNQFNIFLEAHKT